MEASNQNSVKESHLFSQLKSPIIVSHRGGASMLPQNTMVAFKKSVHELKVPILEFDVRLSKDEEIVIMHNQTVDATTDGKGLVSEKTLQELK